MSTHDAFLRAVLSAPADDLPRLVYADFLDETGDPDRAALIRVQCELAKRPKDAPERTPLAEREQELLSQNRERWAVPLAEPVGWMPHQVQFRRGFVEEVNLRNASHWRPAGLAEFLDSPLVALTRLVVSSNDGDDLDSAELARDLLAHPRLEYLTALQFDEVGVSAAAMTVVVTRPHLTRLHHLGFWASPMYSWGDSIRVLADSFALPAVRSLGLNNLYLGDEAVIALAASPRLANLTALGLRGNSFVTDTGAEALADSPHLTRLTHLDLTMYMDRITPAGKARLRARFGDAVRLDP